MTDLRDLECLVALARHRHFARAAAECGLSQPAFSMRIRNLEERLNTAIVKRGNRFQGLTPAGEAVTAHAREIIDRLRAMEQEARAAQGAVTGPLTLAVVPTATAYAGRAAVRLMASHPGIRTRIESATSLVVQQGLVDGIHDAGITYAEGVVADMFRIEPLYAERYVLLAPAALVPAGADSIAWADAAALPLVLLEPGMQNRRILTRVFEDIGATPRVVAETSGFIAALAMAAQGAAATVLPEALAETLGPLPGMVALPLVAPRLEKAMALVTLARPHALPAVEALRSVLIGPAR
jgi:DNA-binding transcriptional LysR family regulator